MVNITIDRKEAKIEVEGGYILQLDYMDPNLEKLIQSIVDRCFYSGETIGIFTREENGVYEEVERFGGKPLITCRYCGGRQ